MSGLREVAKGKITGNQGLVQQGHERKTGELKRKEKQEDVSSHIHILICVNKHFRWKKILSRTKKQNITLPKNIQMTVAQKAEKLDINCEVVEFLSDSNKFVPLSVRKNYP